MVHFNQHDIKHLNEKPTLFSHISVNYECQLLCSSSPSIRQNRGSKTHNQHLEQAPHFFHFDFPIPLISQYIYLDLLHSIERLSRSFAWFRSHYEPTPKKKRRRKLIGTNFMGTFFQVLLLPNWLTDLEMNPLVTFVWDFCKIFGSQYRHIWIWVNNCSASSRLIQYHRWKWCKFCCMINTMIETDATIMAIVDEKWKCVRIRQRSHKFTVMIQLP